jgi:hypothetical protein
MESKSLMERIRTPEFLRDAAVWTTLVAFGVLGRWLQPEWNATPIAAVALFAGYFFAGRMRWALSTPIAVLVISHQLMPAYASWAVMAVVFAAFILPVLLGNMLSRKMSAGRFAAATLMPSLVFYIATNFAVWAFQGSTMGYTMDAAGLVSCYLHALPFYRWMLCSDLIYVAVVFGCYALAVRYQWLPKPVRAVARVS